MVLRLEQVELLGGLVETDPERCPVSGSVVLGWALRICISNKLPLRQILNKCLKGQCLLRTIVPR